MTAMTAELYQLEQDEELRIEADCPKGERVTVELKQGMAEIFGTEMVVCTMYTFVSGAKFSVYTYQGCQLLVSSFRLYGVKRFVSLSSSTPFLSTESLSLRFKTVYGKYHCHRQ